MDHSSEHHVYVWDSVGPNSIKFGLVCAPKIYAKLHQTFLLLKKALITGMYILIFRTRR